MSNIGTTLLIESVAEAMKEWESRSKVDWTRQPHESVKLLRSADKRGASGENFVKKLLEKNGIAPVIWHRRKSAQIQAGSEVDDSWQHREEFSTRTDHKNRV